MLQAVEAQNAPPAPPAAPAPAGQPSAEVAPVAVGSKSADVFNAQANASPHDLLMALQAQREELNQQVHSLERKREEITNQLQENRSQGLPIAGLEQRLKEIDLRISAVDQQVALADAEVAKTASIPGAVQPEPSPRESRNGPPEEVFVLAGLFIVAVLMPLAFAVARRVWKRTTFSASAPALPADVSDRLRSIEQAVESVAEEVERIGEGQRFMSRVLTDRPGDARALGEGAAPVIEVAQRAKVAEPR
jgi:hypothetical protein